MKHIQRNPTPPHITHSRLLLLLHCMQCMQPMQIEYVALTNRDERPESMNDFRLYFGNSASSFSANAQIDTTAYDTTANNL